MVSSMEPPKPTSRAPNRLYCGAHWTIFMPAIVVAVLYGGVWLFLLAAGKGDSALAKIMLLVLLLVVPALLVRAYLRFAVFGVLVGQDFVAYRQGWFRPRWKRLRLDEVTGVKASLSPLGKLLGGGELVLTRAAEKPLRLCDIAEPEVAARQISARMRAVQPQRQPT